MTDEQGRREMANRLLTHHVEVAGAGEAGVSAGSEIVTVQALRVEEIGDLVRRRIGRPAGVSAVSGAGVRPGESHSRVRPAHRRPGA